MPRQTTREESWDNMAYSDTSNEAGDDGYNVRPTMRQNQPQLMTIGEVHRIVHPLQATAARVGKQVEMFAETLDRLSSKREKRANDCRDVLPLVYEYEKVASETVKLLKRYHEPERQEKLKKSHKRAPGGSTWIKKSASEKGDPTSTTVEDLEHWEQEQQTWQLLGLMLQVEYAIQGNATGIPDIEERFQRPQEAPKVHRYSSERDVWKSFLVDDPDMWEKHVVVEWLKSCADSTAQDIDTVIEELESGADRGTGLVAHSWLYSKEAIKNQKRLRSWPQPLDPNSPGIDASLVSADKTGGLITQLDPDAFSRQGRRLEKEDINFEQAMWLACWEMLRRGHSWTSIRDFCQERVEVWRALSVRGDPRLSFQGAGASRDAISGWQSRAIWRKMCSSAAKDGGINDYENAVFGLLSGDFPSVEKVVRGWDDYLFAVYNAQLIQGFDSYTRKVFSHSLPWEVLDKHNKSNVAISLARSEWDGREVWRDLLRKENTNDEALSPIKMLQGSMIAKEVNQYLGEEGLSLGRLMLEGESRWKHSMTSEPRAPQGPIAHVGPEDYDMLRILTHVALVFQALEPLPRESAAIENIIMAYVEYLGKAGKQQLLPLYASRLSYEGSVECMARQLPDINNPSERSTVLKLMQEYGLDVPRILLAQLILITKSNPARKYPESVPPIRILNINARDRNVLPQIQKDFMTQDISGDDHALINGMEWYLLLEGHWKDTMYAGALIYKYFLLSGAWAAARELSRRVPFSTISRNKTENLLGEAVDLGIFSDDEDYDDTNRDLRSRRRSSASAGQIKLKKEYLLNSASTFRDLENVIIALDALENWKSRADDAPTDPRHAKTWKADMQQAHNAVVSSVEPLFEKWLQAPGNDFEAIENANIRARYLPEILLAYNTVLNVSGQFLSREILLKSMDLAALVAAEDAELAACFVQAGRMAELVDALAMSGKTMLRAEEVTKMKGKRGKRGGGVPGLGLWTVVKGQVGGGEEE